ncbi:MAG: trypsin-like peptidase domain-containing protein [Calditrichaeota bacterium]|nr:trypsin-like peptidase domain-containing protein [Calditrichota bacterium]
MRFVFWICILLFLGTAIFSPVQPQDKGVDPGAALREQLKPGVFLLSDEQDHAAYGLYMAGRRDKKYVYLVSLNNLSVGTFGKLQLADINAANKTKSFEADKVESESRSDVPIAVYQVKRSPGDLVPITRFSDPAKATGQQFYTLALTGNAVTAVPVDITLEGENFQVSGTLDNFHPGQPVFSDKGEIFGLITSRNAGGYRTISIAAVIDYTVKALSGEDLYPTWKELYPSQYAIEKVMASAAVLETRLPGTGFFIGRDKDSTGYLLTANHVIANDTEDEFPITFYQDQDNSFDGKVLANSQNVDLDLAIVTVPKCPAYTVPVTFWRPKDLGNLESGTAALAVANVGWTKDRNAQYGYFESKTGDAIKVSDPFVYTTLPVQSGYSGGPIFNENGEVVSIALRAETTVIELEGDSDENAASLKATATTHNRAILKYLDEQLGKVDFLDQWQFLVRPTFWQKNRLWILSGGAATAATTAALLLKKTPPPADLPGIDVIGLPGNGGQ